MERKVAEPGKGLIGRLDYIITQNWEEISKGYRPPPSVEVRPVGVYQELKGPEDFQRAFGSKLNFSPPDTEEPKYGRIDK